MANLLSTDAQEQPTIFESRPAAGKELGLFAASSTTRGTRTIEGEPSGLIPPGNDNVMVLSHLVAVVRGPTPGRRKILDGFSDVAAADVDVSGSCVRNSGFVVSLRAIVDVKKHHALF